MLFTIRSADSAVWYVRWQKSTLVQLRFVFCIMDVETVSTNTSVDDKTEDFCENPTRDTLAEGLMCLLKPTIDQLDERVRATRQVLIFLFCVTICIYVIHNSYLVTDYIFECWQMVSNAKFMFNYIYKC